MGTAIWVVQGILAFAFLGAGSMKLMKSRQDLIDMGMGYAEDYSDGTVKLIGAAEVLGAIGLIVPPLTGIVPILSPVAAAALAVVMMLAAGVHARRGELPMMAPNVVLFSMAAFIVWGRFIADPFV